MKIRKKPNRFPIWTNHEPRTVERKLFPANADCGQYRIRSPLVYLSQQQQQLTTILCACVCVWRGFPCVTPFSFVHSKTSERSEKPAEKKTESENWKIESKLPIWLLAAAGCSDGDWGLRVLFLLLLLLLTTFFHLFLSCSAFCAIWFVYSSSIGIWISVSCSHFHPHFVRCESVRATPFLYMWVCRCVCTLSYLHSAICTHCSSESVCCFALYRVVSMRACMPLCSFRHVSSARAHSLAPF